MLIGYARISTLDQTLALQRDALTTAGYERIFTDTASGSRTDRPELDEALDFARPSDTLVIWQLDRLGRSLRHLIDTVALLQERGIGLKSLHEQLDTTTSGGRLVFPIFDAPAGCEPGLIRKRTQAGPTPPAPAAGAADAPKPSTPARHRSPIPATTRPAPSPAPAAPYASPDPPCTGTSPQRQGSWPKDGATLGTPASKCLPLPTAGKRGHGPAAARARNVAVLWPISRW